MFCKQHWWSKPRTRVACLPLNSAQELAAEMELNGLEERVTLVVAALNVVDDSGDERYGYQYYLGNQPPVQVPVRTRATG